MTVNHVETRSACDRCHRRKIRCVVGSEPRRCERCIAYKFSCVFSAPGRNGRPPCPQKASEQANTGNVILPMQALSYERLIVSDFVEVEPSLQNSNRTISLNRNPSTAHQELDQLPGYLLHSTLPQFGLNDSSMAESQFNAADGVSMPGPEEALDLQGSQTLVDSSTAFNQYTPLTPKIHLSDTSGEQSGKTPRSSVSSVEQSRVQANLHKLQVLQCQLARTRAVTGQAISLGSNPSQCVVTFGNSLHLIGWMHHILKQFTARYGDPHQTWGQHVHSFTTGISLISALVSIVELYELGAQICASTPPSSSPRSLSSSSSSTSLSSSAWQCRHSIDTPSPDKRLHLPGLPISPENSTSDFLNNLLGPDVSQESKHSQARDDNSQSFQDSPHQHNLAQWTLASALLYQIHATGNILGQLRERFMRPPSRFFQEPRIREYPDPSLAEPRFSFSSPGGVGALRDFPVPSSSGFTGLFDQATNSSNGDDISFGHTPISSSLTAESSLVLLQLYEDLIRRKTDILHTVERAMQLLNPEFPQRFDR
ncbi:MAG: hypothetical protein Q9227_007470 [Pyrenula ochraceoflavens]